MPIFQSDNAGPSFLFALEMCRFLTSYLQSTKRHSPCSINEGKARSQGRLLGISYARLDRIRLRQKLRTSLPPPHAMVRVSPLAQRSNWFTRKAVDYKTFLTILNRPDGFKPAGTPGTQPWFSSSLWNQSHSIFREQRNSFVDSRCLTRREMVLSVLGS